MDQTTLDCQKAKDGLLATCDFCGRKSQMLAWNSRTCLSCRAEGAPDQSVDKGYDDKLQDFLRLLGIKKPLTGRAAALRANKLEAV